MTMDAARNGFAIIKLTLEQILNYQFTRILMWVLIFFIKENSPTVDFDNYQTHTSIIFL